VFGTKSYNFLKKQDDSARIKEGGAVTKKSANDGEASSYSGRGSKERIPQKTARLAWRSMSMGAFGTQTSSGSNSKGSYQDTTVNWGDSVCPTGNNECRKKKLLIKETDGRRTPPREGPRWKAERYLKGGGK